MPIEVLLGALAGVLVASVGWLLLLRRAYGEREEAREEQERARRRQRESEAEMHALEQLFSGMLDAVPRPVFVTSRDRVILQANRAAIELTRLHHHQVIGRIVASVIQDYDTTQMLMESAKTGQEQQRVIQRAATDQTWRVSITPLRLGAAGGIFARQKSDSPASEPSNGDQPPTHLVLTIEDLTRLRQLETVRRDFVANVSHELRTPLASVKLLAETLQDAIERDPTAARLFAQRIEIEVSAITQLVNELLELSRIESGRVPLRLKPTDLREVIQESVGRVQNLAGLQGVQVQTTWDASEQTPADDLPLVLADGGRIGQVLLNLLHNAIKFTPPKGAITVGAERTPEDDGQSVTVWVRDTGVGISEDDLPRIFERFYKVDRARTRSQPPDARADMPGGTGLGLAIARHLVEGHGGRIWAESKPGRGSVFRFTLPVATEQAAEA
jgi:two-component system phosphate regulon sensor histidine kinase PhoR